MVHRVNRDQVAAWGQHLGHIAHQVHGRLVIEVMQQADCHNDVERLVPKLAQLVDMRFDDIDPTLPGALDVLRVVVEAEIRHAGGEQHCEVGVAATNVENPATRNRLHVFIDDDLHASVGFDEPAKCSIASRSSENAVTNHPLSIQTTRFAGGDAISACPAHRVMKTSILTSVRDTLTFGTVMTEPPSANLPSPLLEGVSVVVPVYNGAATIRELVDRTSKTFGSSEAWELIFVVDGSPDDSWTVVEELVAGSSHVVGVDLFRNFGQHNALLVGIRTARYNVVVTMDDDLQHRPETIPLLLAQLQPTVDLVYGRSEVEEHKGWRNLSSRMAKAAMGFSIGGKMARDSGALRAFRTQLRDGFAEVSDPYVSIDVLLSWVTTRYTTADTPMDQRESGSSNYNFRKLLRHAINMVTGYSTKPLRLVTWLGFCLAFFGAGTLVYVLVRYATSSSEVPGFAFLASLISILAGAQLFGLGVIGEYLGRMHFRSMQRPPYVVREVLRAPAKTELDTTVDNLSAVVPPSGVI